MWIFGKNDLWLTCVSMYHCSAHRYNCTRSLSDVRTQVNRIHANYNNLILCVKFYAQIFLICVYFLVYLCMYIFTRVCHVCFSRGIWVQYGMKHMCNAAMPVACAVNYTISHYHYTCMLAFERKQSFNTCSWIKTVL